MITTSYYHNFDDFEAAASWLGDEGHGYGLFERHHWFSGLHANCLGSKKPLIIDHYNPMDEKRRGVRLYLLGDGLMRASALANWYSFHWQPVFSGPLNPVEKVQMLTILARRLKRKIHRLELAPVPEEDGMHDMIVRAFRNAGWLAFCEPCDINHYLDPNGGGFDSYWKSRPGQLRSTVTRKSRQYDVSIRIQREFCQSSWDDYEHIYQQSWKTPEGSPEFLRHLAQYEAERGRLRLGLAYMDGRPAAAQFWTVDRDCAYIHKLAHDEDLRKASPGTLLGAAMFQHALDSDRVRRIDFGTGDDGYKRDWMNGVRKRYRITLCWPHSPISWPVAVRKYLSALVRGQAAD